MACIASGANPTQLRAEGETEKTGDVLITCTGGVPTDGAPNVVPTSNIQIFLNTSLTSRLLNATTNASEAMLLVNEPQPATQKVCLVGSSGAGSADCNMYGQGALATDPYNSGTLAHDGTGQAYNVFQGEQVTTGSVTFNGVPIDAPGTQQTLIIRVVNIRANANGLGVTSVNAPPISVTATIATSGTTTLTITNNAQQVVGQVQKGLVVSDSTATAWQQCIDEAWGAAGTITFTKGFAASFKIRNAATTAATPSLLVAQDIPGNIYNSETDFYNPTVVAAGTVGGFPSAVTNAGLADYGTRLRIIFAGVQAGVTIWVPNNVAYSDLPTVPVTVPNQGTPTLSLVGSVPELYAQLVTSESGSYTAATANGSGVSAGYTSLTVGSTNTAEAVYEVLAVRTGNLLENLAVPFFISYTANPGANSPGLGTATVGGSFAPISTDTNASATDTIPRFADTSVAVNAFTIVKCATHLLFPFVTNQAGFDTGFAISNTSMDQYGTSTQTGTCTFNFFGTAAPAAVTTAAAVDPGTTYTNLTSVLAPGFQGYVIVDCQFQYAHGFAFITQIGTFLGTEGYLALIIPDPPRAAGAFPNIGGAVPGEQLGF